MIDLEIKTHGQHPQASPSATLFGVGDRVTWTHVRQNGSRIGFSTRQGKIIKVLTCYARVKMRNGTEDTISLKQLTKEGETTELTKAFMAMGDNGAKPTPNNRI